MRTRKLGSPSNKNEDTPDGLLKRVRNLPRETTSVTDGSVPVADLTMWKGCMNETPVRFLKDDGFNTRVMSKAFLGADRDSFRVKKSPTVLSYSKKDTMEIAHEVVVDAELRIGSHWYRSNFVVED